jgi:Outer membrane lipoprotein carrier protein LolA-like
MTFGRKLNSLVIGVMTCLALGQGVSAAAEQPEQTIEALSAEWTVEQLVTLLRAQREPSVAFRESTYSSLLTEPLITRGLLRFTAPATMEKQVTEPYRERYVIEGDTVTFESERKKIKKTISLEDYPALRSFIEAFRASFTGDAVQLKQIYETTLHGDRRQWTLLLRPHDSPGKSMVDHILLSGSEGRIATITIRATGGDRSVMTLLRGSSP